MSVSLLATVLPAAKDKAGKTVDKLNGFLKGIVKNAPAIALVAAAVPKIMDFMKGALEPFQGVSEAMTELGFTAGEGFQEMADDIANTIYDLQPVAEDMSMWFSDMYNAVQDRDWDALREEVGDGLTHAWDGIVMFFSDTQRMEDIGNFGAAIVNGIGDWLNEMSVGDWNTIFHGIAIAMTVFFENVDWDTVFAGIYNGFNTMMIAITEMITGWWQNMLEEMAGEEIDWSKLEGVGSGLGMS